MPVKKQHADCSPCPVARALDIVGDHWTLLVIRDLLVKGRHEFREMMAGPEGISTNILTSRLRLLGDRGLIASFPHPENATRKVYYLTEQGKGLVHVLVAVSMWGMDAPASYADREARVKAILDDLAEWENDHLPVDQG